MPISIKNADNNRLSCPLCGKTSNQLHFADGKRQYRRCNVCDLLFVPPKFFLSPAAEKAEYDLHQNSPHDQHYRDFLSQLYLPMMARITPNSRGLDFGSGPGPTLSVMFEESGHEMTLFDHFYAPGGAALNQQYDFITASEVVEHLHDPGKEMRRLWQCLKPGGLLGIMTQLWSEQPSLAEWRYKDSASHVSFFSRKTMTWLGQHLGAKEHIIDRNVTIFQKIG